MLVFKTLISPLARFFSQAADAVMPVLADQQPARVIAISRAPERQHARR